MKTHLRFLWCCLALLAVAVTSRAQLTGTLTVPSTLYPTLAAAIDSLNNQGVGAGGATVNLTAGQTAPLGGYRLGSATLNASTSVTKTVTFTGNGNTLTAFTGAGTADGIFFIQGTDYVIINGMNLAEATANTSNTTRMEWGYSLVKLNSAAPFDGCQNVTINNCVITLDKANTSTIGIRAAHTQAGSTSTLSTTGMTVAATNSYNIFTRNTISGVTRGISLTGASSTAANTDRNNKIGDAAAASGNTITYGGAGGTAYGVYTEYDSVITVQNNKFFIGSGQTTTSYGYRAFSGYGNLTVTNNIWDVTSNHASATVYGFYTSSGHSDPSSGAAAASTYTITGNTITGNNPIATSSPFYGFYISYAYCKTLNLTNNTIRDMNWNTSSGSYYGFYTNYTYAPQYNVRNNTVSNIRKISGSSYDDYMYNLNEGGSNTGVISIENNAIRSVRWGYQLYGYYYYGPYSPVADGINPPIKTYFRYNVADTIDFSAYTSTSYFYNFIYYGGDTTDKSYNRFTNIQGPATSGFTNENFFYSYTNSAGAYRKASGNVLENLKTNGTTYIYNEMGYYSDICDSNRMANFNVPSGTIYNYLGYNGNKVRASYNVVKNLNLGAATFYNYLGAYAQTDFVGSYNVADSIATTGTLYAFYTLGTPGPVRLSHSRISNLYTTGTSNAMYGYFISANAGGDVTLFNNVYSNIEFGTGYSNTSSSAFYLSGSVPYRVYHNTVRVNPANQGGFTGILYTSGATLDLRNNIINVNATPSGTTFTTALRRNTGTANTPPSNFLPSSNGNIYYAPNVANSWLYGEGGSAAGMVNAYSLTNDPAFNTPCGLFKSFMAHDFGSFTENILVAGTTPNTYRPTGTSYAEQGAVPTAFAIPNDYDNVTRGTIADIGALEFAGTPIDNAPPVISYTPVPTMSYCVSQPQITATITDVTGVNTTTAKPRLYYKKSNNATTDADVFGVANNNTGNGWKWVEPTSMTGNTYVFDFQYGLLRSPVVPGDTITYFIIAQDNATVPNTGFNVANFSQCPSTVALGAANGPLKSLPPANGFRVLTTPIFRAVSFPPAACLSGSTVVTVDPVPHGASIQWQSATIGGTFSNITGATNTSYTTPVLTSTMRYRAVLSCGSATLATTTIDTFIIANPGVLTVTGATRCGFGPLTLGATTTPFSTAKWYTSATGGSMVGAGNSFNTGNINSTTTYYVSGTTSNASLETVTAPKTMLYSYASGVGGINLTFKNASTNLYSTTVYPYYATPGATFDVELWDSASYASGSGTPKDVVTVTIPFAGTGNQPLVVALGTVRTGFRNLAPGAYVLAATNFGTGANLHYHYIPSYPPPYPYTSPSGGSVITTGFGPYSPGSSYYWYFYNNVVGADCESSTRTPVVANVTTAPAIKASSPEAPGICIGGTATIGVTSPNPDYVFTWTPGSLVGTTHTLTPAATTIYRVTATDPYTGCVAVDSVRIAVNAQPAPPVITPNPATICAGKAVQLTASAPPGTAGVGSLGTGTTASYGSGTPVYGGWTKNQSHYLITKAELNSMGIIGPNLLTSWAFNVSATGYRTNNFQIKIAHAPGLANISSINCAYPGGFTQVFSQALFTAAAGWNTMTFNIANFAWNGNDPIVIAITHDNDVPCTTWDYGSTPGVTSHTTTNTSVVYTYSDQTCNTTSCTPSSSTYTSTTRPNMRMGFMAPSSVNWLNVTRLFKNTGLTTAVSLTDTTKSPFAAPTVTTVYRAISNLEGCKSLPSLPDTVYVIPSPDVTITPAGPQTICAGQTVTLCIPTAVNQTYQWLLNNNPIAGGTSNCYTATAAGNYKVTATNLVTGCANTSIDIPVTVNPAPVVTVTQSRATAAFCKGLTDTLTASGTGIVSYQWKDNGVNIAGATSPTFIVTASGTYTVEVVNANGCVGTSAPINITVNVTPTTITPMGPTTFCNGFNVTLQGPVPPTGTTYTYQWREAGVNIPAPAGVASTYTTGTTGSYTVVVTNTATGCSDSSVATVVNVGPPPSSVITPNGNVGLCQGSSVTLNAISQPGLCFQWNLNGTPIANATSSTYVATTSGSYTVTVSICGSTTCLSTSAIAADVAINPLPTATATPAGATTFCQGSTVVLNANAGTNLAYQWNLNGNPIQGQTTGALTVANAGSYTVTVTNTVTGCSNVSNAVTVVVDNLPPTTVTPGSSTTFCQGGNVNLCVPTGATAYRWNLNGNPITGATNACYTATGSGLYSVTVTGSNSCVSTSAQTSVQVNALPNVTTVPTGNAYVCQGYSIQLTVGADTNNTYQWMLSNVNIAGATNATYSTAAAGTYKVVVTNKVTGCTATSADIIVTVNTPPTATATLTGPSTICQGDSATISANSGPGFMYQWRRNGVNLAGETASVLKATQSGSYTVNISNATNCFNISNSIVITVNPRPAAYITYNTPLEFCEGSAVVLTANTGTGLTYKWLMNGVANGNTGTFNEAKVSGRYALLVTNNLGCTNSSDTLNILVHPAPVPTLVANGNTMETTTPYLSYQWFFNNEPIGGATAQSYTYTANGAYKVRVIDIFGCEGMSNLFFVNNVGIPTTAVGKSIRVFPNPTTGIVNIDASIKVKAVLRDVAGKLILEEADVKQINLGDVANGMYMLYISDMNGTLLRAEKVTKTAH